MKLNDDKLWQVKKEGKIVMKGCKETTTLKTGEEKILAVKVEFEKSNKVTIRVSHNQELIEKIKKILGRRWDPKGKYWESPHRESFISELQSLFGESIIIKPYMYLLSLQKEFSMRRYSRRETKSYVRYNRDFLLFTGKKLINALKFFYREILNKRFIYEVKHLREHRKLSIVLSKHEVYKILNAFSNIKHKAIWTLIYSANLRVVGVAEPRSKDINSERELIYIKRGKELKDRYTILSQTALKILRDYYSQYKLNKWLFEGTESTVRTVQTVFKQACRKARVNKDVAVHSSRHSFVAHFLESVVDLRYIQEILEHISSKTVEIYMHVSKSCGYKKFIRQYNGWRWDYEFSRGEVYTQYCV